MRDHGSREGPESVRAMRKHVSPIVGVICVLVAQTLLFASKAKSESAIRFLSLRGTISLDEHESDAVVPILTFPLNLSSFDEYEQLRSFEFRRERDMWEKDEALEYRPHHRFIFGRDLGLFEPRNLRAGSKEITFTFEDSESALWQNSAIVIRWSRNAIGLGYQYTTEGDIDLLLRLEVYREPEIGISRDVRVMVGFFKEW